jgi:hypothetical protein
VNVLANGDFLKEEKILNELVVDVFSHLSYLNERNKAEEAQMKFLEEIEKNKRGRR